MEPEDRGSIDKESDSKIYRYFPFPEQGDNNNKLQQGGAHLPTSKQCRCHVIVIRKVVNKT
jgi:hypothetical protein